MHSRLLQWLREWKPALFNNTDFKITDHVDASHGFKALTIRRTDELVAYGLADERAPSLEKSQAQHVDADQYHELMKDKDAVIIDVRNAYESAIGHFQPPPGGATLIDPKMRNSHEFPKWLNAPETKAKLHGKTVMMYCTGGIRCERATALLNQMTEAEADGSFKPKDVVMARGGIERYLKTFPKGGFWKGKNYLFDKRMEQVPGAGGVVARVEMSLVHVWDDVQDQVDFQAHWYHFMEALVLLAAHGLLRSANAEKTVFVFSGRGYLRKGGSEERREHGAVERQVAQAVSGGKSRVASGSSGDPP